MEDVLDLYHEEFDPERPVVCFDETSKQLLGDLYRPGRLGCTRSAAWRRYGHGVRAGRYPDTCSCSVNRRVAGGASRFPSAALLVDFAHRIKWLVDRAQS